MAEGTQAKWEGKARAKILGSTPEQVWPLMEDFCSLNKILPIVDTCHQVEGVYGQPGLIRYCASTESPSDKKMINWCHEKLLAMDPLKGCLTYEILDNNIGFKSYVATWKLMAIDDDGDDDKDGCQIEWSFVADPVEEFTFEGFLTFIDSSLKAMAEIIGKKLKLSASPVADDDRT